MRVVKTGADVPLSDAERVAILSDELVARFGANACAVVERQIESHDSDEMRATWIAIWDGLCSPAARRA